MTQGGGRKRSGRKAGDEPGQDPFGTWLQRSLVDQYQSVLNEPIPQNLLDMIEADRVARDTDLPPVPDKPKPKPR